MVAIVFCARPSMLRIQVKEAIKKRNRGADFGVCIGIF
jgi:hypothetical protein